MSCSSIDLKAYALGELDGSGTREAAAHVHTCSECRNELERLRLTHMALFSLRDEEPPRRIAFVSDKVFEPKWWQRMWRSAPAMGFASAALLSCAILVHAYTWPAPPVIRTVPPVDVAAIEQRVETRLKHQVTDAVARAVADVRRTDEQKLAEMVTAAQRKYELQRRTDLAAFRGELEMHDKLEKRLYLASANLEERP